MVLEKTENIKISALGGVGELGKTCMWWKSMKTYMC